MKLVNIKTLFSLPSLLNIVGIAIAIAAFYVLVSLADHEFTFNKSIDRHGDIYQLTNIYYGSQNNNMPRPLSEHLGRNLSPVESFGIFQSWGASEVFVNKGGVYNKIALTCAGCTVGLFDVFGFRFAEGDTARFKTHGSMVISRKNAEKYGLKVGDMVKTDIQNTDEVEIVAVYDDFEHNTEFAQYGGFLCIGDDNVDNPSNWNYTVYMKMFPGSGNPSTVMPETLKDLLKTYIKSQGDDEDDEEEAENFSIQFVSLDDLHFHAPINGFHQQFDKKLAYTIVILAIFVIVIAFINYFNFFMARVPLRLKSINTRKVLGDSRESLIMSVVGESVIFTVISIALAAVIVYVVIASLVSGLVRMDELVYSNYKALIITILTALTASVLTSLYPAFHITSVPPAMALKGQMTQRHDSVLRYFLIGFQVAASVLLIICSLFVHKNNDYFMTRDIGFDRSNILSTFTTSKIADSPEAVRQKLLQNSDIIDVTWAANDFIKPSGMNWGRKDPADENKSINFDVYPVAWNFLNFMGIEIAEGRDFAENDHLSADGVIIFNETAKNQLGISLESPISGHHPEPCTIAGFCKDFNSKPLQYGISPYAFYVFGKDPWAHWPLRRLYVRTAKDVDVQKTTDYIKAALIEIDPDYEILNPEIVSFEKEVERNYANEKRVMAMVTIFTIIAIIISVMGIFGIVLFDTERRRKEIGIRKVNGATVVEILAMFNRKFLILTAICSVVAIPLAYIIVNAYFSQFAYHYAVNAWPFILGVLMAMIVTSVVVSGASFKAANENPVKTLKTE